MESHLNISNPIFKPKYAGSDFSDNEWSVSSVEKINTQAQNTFSAVNQSHSQVAMLQKLDEMETQFKERYGVLRRIYDSRISQLMDQVRQIQSSVEGDAVARAMGEDPTMSLYMPQRISEVIDTELAQGREAFIHSLSQQLSESEARNKTLKRELSKINNQNLHLSQNIGMLERDVNSSTKKMQKISDMKSEINRAKNSFQSEMMVAENTIGQLKQDKQAMQKEIETLSASLRHLESSRLQDKQNVSYLESKFLQSSTQADSKEGEVRLLTTELSRMREDLTQEKQESASLRQKIMEEKRRCAELKARLEVTTEQRSSIQAKVEANTHTNEELKRRVKEEKTRSKLLESKLNSMSQEVERVLAIEAQQTSESLQKLQLKLQRQKDVFSEDVKRYKRQLRSERDEKDSFRHQLESTKAQLQVQTAQAESLQREVESLRIRMENAEAKNDGLERTAMDAQARASEAQHALQLREEEGSRVRQLQADQLRISQQEAENIATKKWSLKLKEMDKEWQIKYQEMVSKFQNELRAVAHSNRAESDAVKKLEEILRSGQISRNDHDRLVALDIERVRTELKSQHDAQMQKALAEFEAIRTRELSDKLSQLQIALNEKESEIKEWKSSSKAFERQLHEQKSAKLAAARESDDTLATNRMLADRLDEARTNILKLKGLVQEYQRKVEDAEFKISQQKTEFDHKVRELEGQAEADLMRSKREIDQHERQLEKMQWEMTRMEQELAEYRHRNATIRETTLAFEEQGHNCKADLRIKEDQLDQAERKMRKLTDQLHEVETLRAQETQKHIQVLQQREEEFARREADWKQRSSAVDTKQREAMKLELELQKVQHQLEQAILVKSEMSGTVQKLEDSLATKESEMSKLRRVLDLYKGGSRRAGIFTLQKGGSALAQVAALKEAVQLVKSSAGHEMQSFRSDMTVMLSHLSIKTQQTIHRMQREMEEKHAQQLENMAFASEAEQRKLETKLVDGHEKQCKALTERYEKEISTLNEDINTMAATHQAQIKDAEERGARLSQSHVQIGSAKEKFQTLYENEQKLSTEKSLQIEQLSHDLEKITSLWQQEKLRFEEGNLNHNAEIEKLENKSAQANQRLAELSDTIQRHRQTIQSLFMALAAELNLDKEILEGLFSTSEVLIATSMSQLQNTIKERIQKAMEKGKSIIFEAKRSVEEQLNRAIEKYEVLEQEKYSLESQSRDVERKCERQEQTIQELEQELQKLQQQNKRQQALARSNSEVKMIAELGRIEMESELKSLRSQLAEVQARHQNALTEIEASAQSKLVMAQNQAQEEIKRIQREQTESVKDVEVQLANEKMQHLETREKLLRQVQIAKSRLTEVEERYASLQQKEEKSSFELAQMQQQVSSQKARISQLETRLRDADSERRISIHQQSLLSPAQTPGSMFFGGSTASSPATSPNRRTSRLSKLQLS